MSHMKVSCVTSTYMYICIYTGHTALTSEYTALDTAYMEEIVIGGDGDWYRVAKTHRIP